MNREPTTNPPPPVWYLAGVGKEADRDVMRKEVSAAFSLPSSCRGKWKSGQDSPIRALINHVTRDDLISLRRSSFGRAGG